MERKFYPHFAVWELTNRCNARCIHCGSDSGSCRENELTEKEALQLCEDLHDLGCKQVGIIGGEFFLSPFWEKVTKKLLDLGIHAIHLTNGLLLNEKNMQKLKAMSIDYISISIDGIGETHDYIRGVPGLYQTVLANIAKAQAEGFKIGINTTISRRNLGELKDLHQLFLDLNIRAWQLQGVEDFGRANANPELSLGAADFYQAVQQVAEFRKNPAMRVVLGDNIGHFCSFEHLLRDKPFTGCIAGRWNVGIEANGNIRGCLSIRGDENIVGNIRERSLQEIWDDPKSFAVHRNKPVEKMGGFCRECEYVQICRGGCSSLAHSLTEDIYENPICLHKYEVEQGITQQKLA